MTQRVPLSILMHSVLVISLFTAVDHAAEGARPNIIVILSDDMGFSDLGCYGGETQTPNLDALAKQGVRFTQFYNTGRCCPARASLLTGLYPHQAGIGHMMEDKGHEGYRGCLNNRCRTMAEVLKPAGYATFMTGKWHVSPHTHPDGPRENWPLQRGFDRFYGTIHGAGSFYDPNSLTRDNTQISPFADPEYQPETYYYTDAISDHAVRYISEHCAQDKRQEKPFFLYMAYTAAHWPMHALPEDIEKYKGRFDTGYDALRAERLVRMKDLGLVSPDAEMSPVAQDWSQVKNREWELRCMEVYAAMIDRMDQGIGKVVGTLKDKGIFDNTLILFMQDNGGCAEGLGRQPRNQLTERPAQPTLEKMPASELQTNMIPIQSRDGFPVVMGPGIMPGPADTYIAYGEGWANVSNTPFRMYKHWVHEGGISTPLIVSWPAQIQQKGSLVDQPAHLIDIMATCVDVAEASYPTKVEDVAIHPLEGLSLVPAIQHQPLKREAIFWEHEGNRAIRVDKWKLVAKFNQPWELYDIDQDRSELHDLKDEHPELAGELASRWQSWAERAYVLPLNPKKKKP
ncbi:MAG: arylsulfatase [Planctomycetaceae bacterium]|nr:arylsulfatase [Planctomycetaceae bacterium]